MADAYEPYHVPQQSRRDKLRILSHAHNPSLDTHFHFPPSPSSAGVFPLVDPDFLSSANFMGFLGASPSSSSAPDRACDHSFNAGLAGDVLVFKPEPLSLSLSSHHAHQNNNSLHRLGYELVVPGASRSSGPLGPFTGYASILKGSRFLKPAQQLLEEFCIVGRGVYSDRIDDDDSSLMFDPTVENLPASCGGGGDSCKKKSKLISMLDEVYKRYKQYYEQLQAVVASFECVAGLGNAAPYASLALRALSKHFKCLKNAITDQLQFTNKTQQQAHVMSSEKVEPLRFGSDERRGLHSGHRPEFSSDHHPPVWRPHRGLPERAVTVLRAWLFDHFLHPYPTDTDKLMLAKQTGLSRNQVSNWFINARVRLWKPMVEEIHMLETRQAQKPASRRDDRSTAADFSTDNVFPENPSSSAAAQRLHYSSPPKRTRNDDVTENFTAAGNGTLGFSYGGQNDPVLSTNSVSLTLGLHHQNNGGLGLTEPFPINVTQRFGIGGGEGYVGGGQFEGQNGQFGRDFIGSSSTQLLHDFVG